MSIDRSLPAAFVLVILLAGCSVQIKVAKYIPKVPLPTNVFIAGAAKVDITPPPGYPLGGHSIGGQMARGYWTRLYARAFYFQRPGAPPLALISCDLFAIPAGLHARVAQILGVPPETLLISATHTHHGPAGYMSSAVFNFGGPLPGYDEALAKHLVDGVVHAYNKAKDQALPGASLVLRTGTAINLQRNRAIDAFYRNAEPDRNRVLGLSSDARMTCPDGSAGPCPRFQAADPTLTVLQVRRDGHPTALLVFYAIHNTSITHDCTLYQADLSGYAMHLLETAGKVSGLIAGFFNGAEGDISPRWITQDRADLVHIGGQLAAAVQGIIAKPPDPAEMQSDPEIAAARQEFSAVPRSKETNALTLPGSGVGELGGAEDGRTILYAYGWHGGVTISGADVKMPALTLHNIPLLKILQGILGSPGNYPNKIPVATATLGTLSLAAIPTEMTAVQGAKLRADLQEAVHRPFVVVGLANEYIGYTTTESEYKAQNYEGASTMYGPKQGDVLSDLLKIVANHPPPSPKQVPSLNFNAGSKVTYKFTPELYGEKYNMTYENLEPLMNGPQRRIDDGAPRFQWDEPATADWNTAAREVTLLRQTGEGWKPVDDTGLDVLSVLVEARPNQRTWTAIWVPEQKPDRSASYSFAVRTADGRNVCSVPFTLPRPLTTVPPPSIDTLTSLCPSWSKL